MAKIDKKKLERGLRERYKKQQRRGNVEKFEKELKETRNFINEVRERQAARLAEKAQKAQEEAVKSKERDLRKAKEQKNIFKNTPPSLVEVREKIKKQKLTSSLQKKTIIEDDQEKLKIITDSLESDKKDKNREKPEFFKPYFAKAKDSLGYLKQINNNLKELKSKFVDKQDTSIKEKEKTKEPKESFLGKFKDDMKNKVSELPKSIWDKIKSLIGGTFNAMLVGLLGRDMLRWLTGGFKLAFKATKGLGKLLIHFIKFIPTILRFFFVTPIGRALLAGGVTLFNFLKGFMNPDKKEVIDKSGSNRVLSGAHNTLKMLTKGTDWALNKVGINSTFTQDLDEARKNQNSVDVDKKILKFFEQTKNGRATDLENRLKSLNDYKNAKKDWAWYADFFNNILGISVNDGINLKNKFLGLFREYLRANYWKKDSGKSYSRWSVYDFDNHRINEEALKTAYLNFITQKSDLTRMFTFLGDSKRGEILRKLLYDDKFLSIQAGKALTTAEQRRKYNVDVNKQISNIITKVNNDRIDPVDDGPLKTSQANQTMSKANEEIPQSSNEKLNNSFSVLDTANTIAPANATTNVNIPNTGDGSIGDYTAKHFTTGHWKEKNQNKPYKSGGMCATGVKLGLQKFGIPYKRGNAKSFINGYNGLQMITKVKAPQARTIADKMPPGTVAVNDYQPYGHMQIKASSGQWVSDFIQPRFVNKDSQPNSNVSFFSVTGASGLAQNIVNDNTQENIQVANTNNQVVQAQTPITVAENTNAQSQQSINNIINLGEQQDRSDYGPSLFPYFSTLDYNTFNS